MRKLLCTVGLVGCWWQQGVAVRGHGCRRKMNQDKAGSGKEQW